MLMVNLIVLLIVGGAVAGWSQRINPDWPRWVSLGFLTLACLYLYAGISTIAPEQFSLVTDPSRVESWLLHYRADWIPRFGISFELAMDGVSLLLIILTLLLGLVAVISSWDEIKFQHGFFQANLMWTLAGVVGVFLSVDLLLFFLFWEVMLIPMYFLIAIWGHEDKSYAAMKFFIFTQAS